MVLSIVLLMLTTYWAINMHRTIDRSQPLMCSIMTTIHDIQFGYKDKSITFAGIGGTIHFLSSLKTESEKMKDATSLDNIINRKLGDTASEYSASLNSFYTIYKSATVKGCKPAATPAGSNDVVPGVVKSLTDNINDGVKTEKEQIVKIANKINNISKNVKQLGSG